MNLVSKMIAAARGEELEENEHVDERKRPAPWHSYRSRPAGARVYRRVAQRDAIAADRKRKRLSRRRERAIHVITEREVVRRVRAWEAENGSALVHLLKTGAVTDDDLIDGHGIPMFEVADKLGLLTEVSE